MKRTGQAGIISGKCGLLEDCTKVKTHTRMCIIKNKTKENLSQVAWDITYEWELNDFTPNFSSHSWVLQANHITWGQRPELTIFFAYETRSCCIPQSGLKFLFILLLLFPKTWLQVWITMAGLQNSSKWFPPQCHPITQNIPQSTSSLFEIIYFHILASSLPKQMFQHTCWQ